MSVHYKFKSALSFDTIPFDGLHISVRDLKRAILQQKQIGKATDFDLQITNAQSNEVYEDDSLLIPKNSSLIVVRVPLTAQQKKNWEKNDTLPALNNKQGLNSDYQDPLASRLAKTVDLANVDASEGDKIQAAITQSTLDYDPSNYLRIKGSNQVGELPPNYRCYKCLQPGHWIKDCKLNAQQDNALEIKKSTGIPRSFMVPVEGPGVPGAMMTPTGHFAVPSIDHEARREPLRKPPLEPPVLEKPGGGGVPQDLLCGVCKDLLSDAVLIPCCGNSFCDECIRNVLLESEEHQCPDCKETGVSPDTLIPNRFLRNSVNNFKNQTGYIRAALHPAQPPRHHRPQPQHPHQQHPPSSFISIDPDGGGGVGRGPGSGVGPGSYTPASPDMKELPSGGPGPEEFMLAPEDVRSGGGEGPRVEQRGSAIPSLQSEPPSYPHQQHQHQQGGGQPPPRGGRHPLPATSAPAAPGHPPNFPPLHPSSSSQQSHHDPNPNTVFPKGGDNDRPPHPHYLDKPHGAGHYIHNSRGGRGDRSGTPTVDEARYQVPVHQQPTHHPPPGLTTVHVSGPPASSGYPRGNGSSYMYRGGGGSYRGRGAPYNSGMGGYPYRGGGGGGYRGGGRGHPRGGGPPPYHRLQPSPPPLSSHHLPPNSASTVIPTGTIDDPLEVFQRLMSEKDAKKRRAAAAHRPRSGSRSPYSRSPSRGGGGGGGGSRSPPGGGGRSSRSPPPGGPHLRGPSSRSRSRTRVSSRTKSRSPRSPPPPHHHPPPPLRRRRPPRSRSRSFSISSRSSSRSRSRSADYSPPPQRSSHHPVGSSGTRGRDYRGSPRLPTSPIRHYGARGYEPAPGSYHHARNGRGRYPVKPLDHFSDYSRDGDRYERGPPPGRGERDRGEPRDRETDRDRGGGRGGDRGYHHPPAPYSSSSKRGGGYDQDYDHGPPPSSRGGGSDPARDWEKTRDREIEMREKEKQMSGEGSSYYSRKREQRGNPVETIETNRESLAPPGVEEDRNRVLVDLPIRSEPPEKSRSPEKEKKTKEKKKKKKEESEKKKKKKKTKEKADKKEALEEGEIISEEAEDKAIQKLEDTKQDALYGDLGANVDQFVVESYNKAIIEEKKVVVSTEKDVMLAPVPELSKWEKEERDRQDRGGEELTGKPAPVAASAAPDSAGTVVSDSQPAEESKKQVTSEILERALNVITKKAVKPQEKVKVERKTEGREKSRERETERSKEGEITRGRDRDVKSRERDIRSRERERGRSRDRMGDVRGRERERDVRSRERERDVRSRERERDVRSRERDIKSRDRERGRSRERERVVRSRERDIRSRERERVVRSREREREVRTEKERPPREDRHREVPKSVALPVSGSSGRRSSSRSRGAPSTAQRPPSAAARISAKERLGAKIDDKPPVKRDVRLREVKPTKRVVRREPSHTSKKATSDPKPIEDTGVKKSTDEAVFVADYEKSEHVKETKKRRRSVEEGGGAAEGSKKPKQPALEEEEAEEGEVKPEKEKTEEGSSEDSSASSEDSEEERSRRKRKRRKHKKRKSKRKRHDSTSDSDSDSDSSLSESDKKKKKHRHKSHKKSKKRKKSKK